jgi:hypothetical protein
VVAAPKREQMDHFIVKGRLKFGTASVGNRSRVDKDPNLEGYDGFHKWDSMDMGLHDICRED